MQSAAAGPVGVGPNKREATAARTLKLQPVPTVFFFFLIKLNKNSYGRASSPIIQ